MGDPLAENIPLTVDLDSDVAEPRAEMAPATALEKLRRGEPVENVRVVGLIFRGEFELPVRLRQVTLVRPEFKAATFKAEVSIVASTVDRPTFNRKNVFRQALTLSHSVLNKAIVRDVTVEGPFTAAHVQARGKLGFLGCTFNAKVSFWEAKFNCWADWKDCTFAAEADFRSMHANEGLVFAGCTFLGDCLLRGTAVQKKFQLDTSRFEGLLDLSKAKLVDFTYMEAIEQGEKHRLAFLNAVAERIQIRPEQVEGRLLSEHEDRWEDAMREYGLLKRSYSNLHRFDMEDWAFYQFKVCQRRCCGRSWWRPWTKLGQFADWLFLDQGCGYGTRPGRAVRAALIVIFAFAVLYAANFEMFYVEKVPFTNEAHDSPANRTVTSLMMSVSVFTSGLSGIRDLAKEWMTVPLMVESLLGTFLWGLFIVAFSRKVIR